MLENFFLTYANHSLRDNPENLHKIFEEIFSYCPREEVMTVFAEWLIEYIIELERFNDPRMAEEIRKKWKKDSRRIDFGYNLIDVAYEAIYQYRKGFCGEKCLESYNIDYTQVLKKSGLNGNERLKCYECYQLVYINYLSELVLGKKLEDMIAYWIVDEEILKADGRPPDIKIGDKIRISISGSFESLYLRPAYDCVRAVATITDDGKLETACYVRLGNLFGGYPVETRFVNYLNSLVGYSLTEFLLNNNQKKLKRCDECKKFYVSKTIRPSRFCSNQCRLAWHNRKRIESGEAKEYKRKKRREGAKESYYG